MNYIPFPDISPEIFTINLGSFAFSLRWYALAYIAGLLGGWWIIRRAIGCPTLWPAGTPPMTSDQVERLLTWVILGVVLGGRLGFVLFYEPGYYLANPSQILQVWQGGMSFHGGFLGVVAAVWIFSQREGAPKLSVADMMALGVPPGLFFGRIANFINAELWGRPTDLTWGVAFPGEAAQTCEGIAGICARHPSQIYEALLEGVLLFALIWLLILRRHWLKWPGAICGVFVAGYGISRFLVEFVRQPDAQFVTAGNPLGLAWQVGGYGLTQGQALSLPMVAAGLFLIARARRA